MRPEVGLKLKLVATVAPSEDRAKVLVAMKNIVGDCSHSVEEKPDKLRMTSEDRRSLDRLHDQLRDRHVRAAARRLLLAGTEGNSVTVMVNRQAAAAGVVVLCGSREESPLGPVYLTIESDRLEQLIQWLTAYEG